MDNIYNIYCDESCHLENHPEKGMVLGALWCPLEKTREVANSIRDIKTTHNLPRNFKIKWTKVSPAKLPFYIALIEYFFSNEDLHFRALLVPESSKIEHGKYAQDHDTWYYKMYFDMLKVILSPKDRYRIYLDIKDTRSASKVAKLREVLCNNMYDFKREIIEPLQTVRSREVEQIQLVDLLIGTISYANRGLTASEAKLALVERMRALSGYSLTKTTLLREMKVNLFRWDVAEVSE
jgi:hypothetical protein